MFGVTSNCRIIDSNVLQNSREIFGFWYRWKKSPYGAVKSKPVIRQHEFYLIKKIFASHLTWQMGPLITFKSMTNQANLIFVIHLNHICPDLSLERIHNYPICLGTNTTFVSWINMDKYDKYHICSMFEPYLSLVKSVFSPSVIQTENVSALTY